MRFTIGTKVLLDALTQVQVKGKYVGINTFTNSSLGTIVYLTVTDNQLSIYNGDATFLVRVTKPVTQGTNGSCVIDVAQLLSYLKGFGDTTSIAVGDFVSVSSGTKRASLPRIVQHDISAYERMKSLLQNSGLTHTDRITVMPKLFSFTYEAGVVVPSDDLISCFKSMELVNSGSYRVDLKEGTNGVVFSSRQSIENNYQETITPTQRIGEPATVQFSSPIHKLFDKGEVINMYLRDDSPLLLLSGDKVLLKAPTLDN